MTTKVGTRYKIVTTSTEDSICELKKLLETIGTSTIKSANIRYDCSKGIGKFGTRSYFPLTLRGKAFEILVSCVTTGCSGTGSRGMIEALKMAGFNVTEHIEKVIYTRKRMDYYIFKSES